MRSLEARFLNGATLALCVLLSHNAWGQTGICADGTSHLVMDSASYTSQPGVTFVLHHFAATLVPMGKTAPSCLQKMTEVSHADIFVSNESLTRVFAKKLAAEQTDIHDLKIVHSVGKVTITGEMTKLIPIKFSIEGPVSTDGTNLTMTAEKIDADGIPIKMLLGMVGKHLSSVLGLKGVSGVQVVDNQMSFSPEKVAHLRGHLTSVEATPQGLTLHYGRGASTHAHTVAKLARPALSPS